VLHHPGKEKVAEGSFQETVRRKFAEEDYNFAGVYFPSFFDCSVYFVLDKSANFCGACYIEGANFHAVNFREKADFKGAFFAEGVDFGDASFDEVNFANTSFEKAKFDWATFGWERRGSG
jgi:uncharacterized protein YjbI with pentapeptide repeats